MYGRDTWKLHGDATVVSDHMREFSLSDALETDNANAFQNE